MKKTLLSETENKNNKISVDIISNSKPAEKYFNSQTSTINKINIISIINTIKYHCGK